MGNSRKDKELKAYKNSECSKCFLSFKPPLKVKTNPKNNQEVLICRDCWIKLIKE